MVEQLNPKIINLIFIELINLIFIELTIKL